MWTSENNVIFWWGTEHMKWTNKWPIKVALIIIIPLHRSCFYKRLSFRWKANFREDTVDPFPQLLNSFSAWLLPVACDLDIHLTIIATTQLISRLIHGHMVLISLSNPIDDFSDMRMGRSHRSWELHRFLSFFDNKMPCLWGLFNRFAYFNKADD